MNSWNNVVLVCILFIDSTYTCWHLLLKCSKIPFEMCCMFATQIEIAVVREEALLCLCLPSCRMGFAWKLMMCASPWMSHAVLIALQWGLGYLMAADNNVFGPVCQRDHLPPNKIWKTGAGGDSQIPSLCEEFTHNCSILNVFTKTAWDLRHNNIIYD